MTKNKTLILMLFIILTFSMLFSSSGCENIKDSENYFETEYFMCINAEDKYCTIFGFTDAGYELEEVVISSEINGLEVAQLGLYFGSNYFTMKEPNMKKIFIPKGVRLGRADLFVSCSKLDKVIFLSITPNFKELTNNALPGSIYAPALYLENYVDYDYKNIVPADVSFMNNYSDEINGGYYWIDDIDQNQLIKTVPPEPTREGYEFCGWCKEAECINQWDFEIDVVYDQNTILYAKWENK